MSMVGWEAHCLWPRSTGHGRGKNLKFLQHKFVSLDRWTALKWILVRFRTSKRPRPIATIGGAESTDFMSFRNWWYLVSVILWRFVSGHEAMLHCVAWVSHGSENPKHGKGLCISNHRNVRINKNPPTSFWQNMTGHWSTSRLWPSRSLPK